MSYSGTDNSSLNVKEIAISNMILNNVKNQFDVNLSVNEIITNLIQNLTQQIEELKRRLDTQTTTVYTGTIQPYAGLALDPTSHTILPPPLITTGASVRQ